MSDKKVRLAIANAVDRKGLIRDLEKGYGVEATGPFSQKSWTFNPDVRPFPYDPIASVRLLKEAGWKDTDGDGILEKDGSKFIIRMLVHAKDEKLRKMAMFVRQNLQSVGVEIQIQLFRNMEEVSGLASSGRFQAILAYFPGSGFDPNEIIKFWYSHDRRVGKVWSYEGSNPELDRLIYSGAVTSDRKIRIKIYKDIHRLVYEEQPACFLYFPFVFHAVSKRIGGTDPFLGSAYMPDNLIKDFYVQNPNFIIEGGDA
jgi:peptide/nickel transport system substrate-binding protein